MLGVLVPLHLELLETVLLFLSLSPSLEGLDITFVVGTDAIPDSREGAVSKQGGISICLSMLQEPRGQTVVVVPLLDCVVPGGEREVFLAVGNQKLFEFWISLPGKLLSGMALAWLLLWTGLLIGTRTVGKLNGLLLLCGSLSSWRRSLVVGTGRKFGDTCNASLLIVLDGLEQERWKIHR